MRFQPISIREALMNIQKKEWVLPITQRPFVWGDRSSHKKVVYRLFDSLYKGYPIGVFLLWGTEEAIPFREFLENFNFDFNLQSLVDEGHWNKKKSLIYDGQQRLQALYSCLNFSFAGEVLCFDLFYDSSKADESEYALKFFKINSTIPSHYLRLSTLFNEYNKTGRNGCSLFRKSILSSLGQLSTEAISIVEYNIDILWKLFNDEENEICGYFSIPSSIKPNEIQEIFVRLNTGGVLLSQAELLFSMIHVSHYDFQERVRFTANEIKNSTGIEIDAYHIIQLIYYIKFSTTKIDINRIAKDEIKSFTDIFKDIKEPLKIFYKRFLHDEFQINSDSLLNSHIALLPMIYYFTHHKIQNLKSIDAIDFKNIKKYFIFSQTNDWSLQAILYKAKELISNNAKFPINQIIDFVKTTQRHAELSEDSILSNTYFILKMLSPKKSFTYIESKGRLNPELEHIFPIHPKENDLPENYTSLVNTIWNYQLGVPGDINSEKSNLMPETYFKDKENILSTHYEFIPDSNINHEIWDYHHIEKFMDLRKKMMFAEFKKLYDLSL